MRKLKNNNLYKLNGRKVFRPVGCLTIKYMDKEKIRSMYSELQGYLSQTLVPEKGYEVIDDNGFTDNLNAIIEELNELTGNDYNRNKLIKKSRQTLSGSVYYVNVVEYRNKIGGLISRLHSEFFKDEPPPFSGMPNTSINVTQDQRQSQSVAVEIAFEMGTLIGGKIEKYKEGSPERNFLEKLKDSLHGIKTASELVTTIIGVASNVGLALDKLKGIFS